MTRNLQKQLIDLEPVKDFFVALDSDGCVFDSMELKHKECFIPNFIWFFNLQRVARQARLSWEHVNLYSRRRGVNRFLGLRESLQLLGHHPQVAQRQVELPDLSPLLPWYQEESALNHGSLEAFARRHDHPLPQLVVEWSAQVSQDVARMVQHLGAFAFAGECLERISARADAMVVSQTPLEALQREWQQNQLDHHIRLIAGQEHGSKQELLALAAKKYPRRHLLMIGDAPGDLMAAQENGLLFFPIIPGKEESSWEKLLTEGLDKFFSEQFSAGYQDLLVAEFLARLPEKPPWETG